MAKKRKFTSLFWKIFLSGFIIFNLMTFSHAWKFTHFSTDGTRTAKPDELTIFQKAAVLLTGVTIPKPQNEIPDFDYEEIWIPTQKNQQMNGWFIKSDSAKGVVILFHGYAGHKGSLSAEALAFRDLGYHAVLVDFLGHGDSPGNSTSLGYGEAFDVIAATHYIKESYPELPILLYGFSMGAAATTRALSLEKLPVDGAIICAPFHTLLGTVKNRFSIMNAPSFPFAEGLVFWGGIQQGFWGFDFNIAEYAEGVSVPGLIMHGGKDERAKPEESQIIFNHWQGPKQLYIFPELDHQSFYRAEPDEWIKTVKKFLNSHQIFPQKNSGKNSSPVSK